MKTTVFEKRKRIADLKAQAKAINALSETEDRDLTPEEQEQFDDLVARVTKLEAQIAREEQLASSDEGDGDDEDKDEERSYRSRRVTQPLPVAKSNAPAIHAKKHRYSLLRALQCGLDKRKVDGLEGEISAELSRRAGRAPQGFFMPTTSEFRDLTTTTGTGGIFVSPELPYIELLRNKMVCKELGATYMTGLDIGKFSIPRQNGAATAYWVGEGVNVTASNETLDQVAFVDKTLGAITTISRKFVYQSSVDAEQFVMNDLAQVMAIELDRAAINGSGSGAVPLGILQNSAIPTYTLAGDSGSGANMSFADAVGMESVVAAANADRGSLKYLTSPAGRGFLKTSPVLGSTFPTFIYNDNQINGHDVVVSNQVPTNNTKGSGTNLTGVIYGNWEDLIIAQWGNALDVLVNPYSNQPNGGVTISTFGEFDVQVRHPESFVKSFTFKTV